MYLAYIDDSGTQDKNKKFQVMTAVIINDLSFFHWEALLAVSAGELVSTDRIESFEEFHAFELYLGKGVFEGVESQSRLNRIAVLLNHLQRAKCAVVYGAVDKVYLKNQLYGSAHPLDFVFRICAKGISEWVRNNASDLDVALMIADDTQDRVAKESIKKSFRQLRPKMMPPDFEAGAVGDCIHDAIYFGDSRDSVGIQIADLCGYFISKHLEGDGDLVGEMFYKTIESSIVNSEIHPQSV